MTIEGFSSLWDEPEPWLNADREGFDGSRSPKDLAITWLEGRRRSSPSRASHRGAQTTTQTSSVDVRRYRPRPPMRRAGAPPDYSPRPMEVRNGRMFGRADQADRLTFENALTRVHQRRPLGEMVVEGQRVAVVQHDDVVGACRLASVVVVGVTVHDFDDGAGAAASAKRPSSISTKSRLTMSFPLCPS
jgi:hypothetical protein